jgi:hypothetical protein
MLIILSIIGFILAIYLVVLVRGHLTMKKVMAGSKGDGPYPEGQEDHNQRNRGDDKPR